MGVRKLLSITLVVFLLSSSAAADELFINLRNDQTVPEQCRSTSLKQFRPAPLAFFAASIEHALERGFDYEYPIGRDDANWLWKVFRDDLHQEHHVQDRLNKDEELQALYSILQTHRDQRDFHFQSEGEVLELLALVDLADRMGKEKYFVSGSVAYREHANGNIRGELDIVVGERESCRVRYVGEAKLGVHSLSKAKKQLQRFRHFLSKHIGSFMNPLVLSQGNSWEQ